MPVRDYDRIEKAVRYVQAHQHEQPQIEVLAHHVGLSPFHFVRLFKRWAGITPKRFLQLLTLEYAKERLAESHSLLETAFDAGLSGTGRLHDLFVTVDAVTPGEFKKLGDGLVIKYGLHETPFGYCFLGVTERGVCALSFIEGDKMEAAIAELASAWPEAVLVEDVSATRPFADAMISVASGETIRPIPLLVRGTNFQIKVWQALLQVPPGQLIAYEDLAVLIGQPTATRAVASAVARNRIGYLIPCHRVLRKSGAIGGYRWGPARNAVLLAWEATHAEHQTILEVAA